MAHDVAEGGVFGHPAVSGVLAVGAIGAPDPGNDEARSVSGRGRTDINYPNRETRKKPDLMGDRRSAYCPRRRLRQTDLRQFVQKVFRHFSSRSPRGRHSGPGRRGPEGRQSIDGQKAVAVALTQMLRDTAIDLGEPDSDGDSAVFRYGRSDALSAIESIASEFDNFALDSVSGFPNSYTEDSTGDGADSSTSDGLCDDGNGNCTLSLRAAIRQADAGRGAPIKYNISGSGALTTSSASVLPTITRSVFIDGFNQPGTGAGTVLIELDGSSAGANVDGLTLTGKGSYIRGLAVNDFDCNGIVLRGSGGEQVIVGNMIGPNPARRR